MSEKLIVDNFAGIDHIELDVGKINILIGPQATGKSICAKLLYFFSEFENLMYDSSMKLKSKSEMEIDYKEKFKTYFPPATWGNSNFEIMYKKEFGSITIARAKKRPFSIQLSYSEYYQTFYKTGKKAFNKIHNSETYDRDIFEKVIKDIPTRSANIFIPSSRTFFSLFHSFYFTMSSLKTLDPFIIDFGKFYETIKHLKYDINTLLLEKQPIFSTIDNEIIQLLSGSLLRKKDQDYILQSDNREVDVSFSSSGQQELLPLVLTLKSLFYNSKENLDKRTVYLDKRIVYIEEPEAHIFPDAQKKIVELISTVYNNAEGKTQFFITTHSPYILTAFNNLMLAGSVEKTIDEEKKKDLYKIIPKEKVIDPKDVRAYSLSGGKCKNIQDKKTGLINDEIIDDVSERIGMEFDALLELKRG